MNSSSAILRMYQMAPFVQAEVDIGAIIVQKNRNGVLKATCHGIIIPNLPGSLEGAACAATGVVLS
jgi:hypothetical protein